MHYNALQGREKPSWELSQQRWNEKHKENPGCFPFLFVLNLKILAPWRKVMILRLREKLRKHRFTKVKFRTHKRMANVCDILPNFRKGASDEAGEALAFHKAEIRARICTKRWSAISLVLYNCPSHKTCCSENRDLFDSITGFKNWVPPT